MRIPLARWIGTSALAILAIGCANTTDGLKKDAEINSKKVAEATKDVGPATTVTPRIKAAILAEDALNDPGNRIDVDSTSETITLSGYVASSALRLKADQLAHAELEKIGGKQAVVNNLEVRPPPP